MNQFIMPPRTCWSLWPPATHQGTHMKIEIPERKKLVYEMRNVRAKGHIDKLLAILPTL